MNTTPKVITTVYLEINQKAALQRLATDTRLAASVLIREAVDDLLKKYRQEVKP